jgi:hypothetical protein
MAVNLLRTVCNKLVQLQIICKCKPAIDRARADRAVERSKLSVGIKRVRNQPERRGKSKAWMVDKWVRNRVRNPAPNRASAGIKPVAPRRRENGG